jgi:DNA-binding transcriptional ArsR family regulator
MFGILLDIPILETFKMKTTMSVNSKSIMQPELRIDFQVLRKSVLVLRAVNHKLRQDMIRLINQEGKMTVTDLYVKLRLEQSVTSQHLALLRRAGVVYTSRDGKYIYYSVDHDRLDEINRLMLELVK